jgi:hypothetical protein
MPDRGGAGPAKLSRREDTERTALQYFVKLIDDRRSPLCGGALRTATDGVSRQCAFDKPSYLLGTSAVLLACDGFDVRFHVSGQPDYPDVLHG